MNPVIETLDWLNNHKEDIWASVVSVLILIENRGGLRGIWSRVLGPKKSSENPGEVKPPIGFVYGRQYETKV